MAKRNQLLQLKGQLAKELRNLDNQQGPQGAQPPSAAWVRIFDRCLKVDQLIETIETRREKSLPRG